MNLKELYEMKAKVQDQIERLKGRKEDRREMLIRVHKAHNNGQEPTEEQIQADWDYIERINQKLSEKERVPIIGPYEDKKE